MIPPNVLRENFTNIFRNAGLFIVIQTNKHTKKIWTHATSTDGHSPLELMDTRNHG